MRRAALVFLLLCSAGARAATNDLQLWWLGSPDNITVCTICAGADNVAVPGDPSAQFRFARMTATLALAFAPAFEDQAQTTGQAGFEMGSYDASRELIDGIESEELDAGSLVDLLPRKSLTNG